MYPHNEPQLLNWQSSYQTKDSDEVACFRLPRQGEPDHNNSRYEYQQQHQQQQQQQDRHRQQQQLSCYSHESFQRKDTVSPVWGHHISRNTWQREEQCSTNLSDRIVFVKKEPLEESRSDSVQQRQEALGGQSVYYSLRDATVFHEHGGGHAQQDSGESNRSLAQDSAGCLFPLDNRARSAGEAGRDGVSLPAHSVGDEGNRNTGQSGDYQAEFRINLYREEERGGMRGESHRNESGGPTQRRGQFYHHAGTTTEGNGHKDGSHVPQGGGYSQGRRAYDWEGSKSVERSSQPRRNLGDGGQREDPGNCYDPRFGQGQRPVIDPNAKAEMEEYYQYDLQISSSAISQGGSGQSAGGGGGSQFQGGEGGQPGRGKGGQPHGGEGGQFWEGEGNHHHGGGGGPVLGQAGGQSGWWEGGQPRGRGGGPIGDGGGPLGDGGDPLGGGGGPLLGGEGPLGGGGGSQRKGGRQRWPERSASEMLANREAPGSVHFASEETGSSQAPFGTEQQTIETKEEGDFRGGHGVGPLTNRAGAEESGGRQTACNSGMTGQSGGRPACNPSSTPYVPCPVTPGEELSGSRLRSRSGSGAFAETWFLIRFLTF
jgi:hypothetical protein